MFNDLSKHSDYNFVNIYNKLKKKNVTPYNYIWILAFSEFERETKVFYPGKIIKMTFQFIGN